MPAYVRKTNRPYVKRTTPITTKERLGKRVGKAFQVIDKCLLNGKGIKGIQLSAAKWIIESDIGRVEKIKQSEIVPEYEKEVLKKFKGENESH